MVGEPHTGEVEFWRDRGGDRGPMVEERGGELKREVLVAPERWGVGAEGSLSEGEELQRLRDERRRVRRVSSRSRSVTM